jgi:superfamily II DNA or RNA helicase
MVRQKVTLTRLESDIARISLPGRHDWRSTDEQEVEKRRKRAREEPPRIRNLNPVFRIHSDFEVRSQSGMIYRIEILDLAEGLFSSTSPDFRVNGLGTDKHVEAVLLHLQRRFPREYERALKSGSERVDIIPDPEGKHLIARLGRRRRLPAGLRWAFNSFGEVNRKMQPEEVLEIAREVRNRSLRISQEVDFWMEKRQRSRERELLRHEYEQKVHNGEFPVHETTHPLYPYQREGALHLAFGERALLADEMGLGKTIQAIAACAILRRMGRTARVLVVTPASLKAEWEEQIRKFTDLDLNIVVGRRSERMKAYQNPPFFTLVNYEQMRPDALEVNEYLKPDVVILDEAQRIKNWSSKTARAVKRLRSRYAFVLTGTPIENRIDELYSIVDFLDPSVFGPLFRFNRRFYELNEKGRPESYRNLLELRERVRPIVLRRRKSDVETELPERADHHRFVDLTKEQRELYREHHQIVGQLAQKAKRRPLTEVEQKILMKELAMMRMVCDTPFILGEGEFRCPKLGELEKVLDGCLADADVKVIIFSEWVRMLELVRRLLEKKKIGYALHTGSVPQAKRRREIKAFKRDPECRVILCSESGGTGLNLQAASVVINCDLPWNPAKLEQRIARAWRKHQNRSVTVINLISRDTIEHAMLVTLADKQSLADGILDHVGELDTVPLRKGGQTFMKRLEQVLMRTPALRAGKQAKPALPADRCEAFAQRAREELGAELGEIEEQTLGENRGTVVLVVADHPDATRGKLESLRRKYLDRDGHGEQSMVSLEVISQETWLALDRLKAAGLITTQVRTRRSLATGNGVKRDLSDETQSRILDLVGDSIRKQTAVLVLLKADLRGEAIVPLMDGLLVTFQMLAVFDGRPEPANLKEPGAAERMPAEGFRLEWLDGSDGMVTVIPALTWMRVTCERLIREVESVRRKR